MAASAPTTAAAWRAIAKQAVQLDIRVPTAELLLVRAANGRRFRPSGPPAGKSARLGAVLVLLYPVAGELHMPLTIRSELLANHRGEVSLPGGATDPEDTGPIATALRECEEEIGVAASGLEVWGVLEPVYILPSNFQITPVVAYSTVVPELHVNPAEVGGVITVSLRDLIDPATIQIERRLLHGHEVDVPFFAIEQQKVWGATALVLSEFVVRVRAVLASIA